MNKRELRDASGRLLGIVRETISGKFEARDTSGRLRGTYNSKTNETRDPSGRLIGKGDLLSSLIAAS